MRKKELFLFSILLIALLAAIPVFAGGPLHRVQVGGPDGFEFFAEFCDRDLRAGCEANFSLTATMHADGSVTGQYADQSGQGNGGFHATIDCLYVEGNQAWVSGVLTHETISDDSRYVGWPVSTTVTDNGGSANDPPDQISWSNIGDPFYNHCSEAVPDEMFDVPQGQVQVR